MWIVKKDKNLDLDEFRVLCAKLDLVELIVRLKLYKSLKTKD